MPQSAKLTSKNITIKTVLKDLLKFAKRPFDEELELSFNKKLFIWLVLLGVKVFLLFTIVWGTSHIVTYFSPNYTLLNKYDNAREHETLLSRLYYSVFLLPIAEELFFRSWLKYRKRYQKILSRSTWNKMFPYLVYLSIFIFALVHYLPKVRHSWYDLLLPILALSQLFAGILYTYARVRLGFNWNMFLHMTWNALMLIAFTILPYAIDSGTHIQQDNYSLDIEEMGFYKINKPKELVVNKDNQANLITDIKANQQTVPEVLEGINGNHYNVKPKALVNLEFHSEEGVTEEELIDILDDYYTIY